MVRPLYRESRICAISTSYAAEEDSPLPVATLLVTAASKPPILKPFSFIPAATPRTSAALVPFSSSRGAVSDRSISRGWNPREYTRAFMSFAGLTAARQSRLTAAARTRPLLWSVWFPAISILPGDGLESPTVVGAQAANELLNIVGVTASFVATEYSGKIYISARAIDEVNVQIIMERLGGGGHMNSAGAQMQDVTEEEAVLRVKEILKSMTDAGEI